MIRRYFLSLLLPILLITAGCSHPATKQAATTPQSSKAIYSPEAGTAATPRFTSGANLSMFDASNGWVVDPYGVYKTTEGGRQWLSATPPLAQKEGQYRVTGSFFFDRKTGWVSASLPGKAETIIYRTEDAGRTWLDATIPDNSIASGGATITFTTKAVGWLLLHRTANNEADNQANIALYQTTDGGATWQKVAESGKGGLPKEGAKAGLSFRNPATGWIVVHTADSASDTLYVTHDGGKNWQPESVALPAAPAGKVAFYHVPQFFNVQDGVLPISLFPKDRSGHQATSFLVAISRDGGQSWTAGTPINDFDFIGNHVSAFLNLNTGLVTDSNKLYLTEDGGKSWSEALTPEKLIQFRGVLEVHILNPQDAWLITGEGLIHGTGGLKDWRLMR
ncbi:MAG: WD40/YVTN/BNR-like repeat-containing protein [Mycobacterium leprae]